MKKALATLIPLCVIGFVGFWISTIFLGTKDITLDNLGKVSQFDNTAEKNWSTSYTVKNTEYTAKITANENLTLDISDVSATIVPWDGEDIEIYVKNSSNRSVNVSLSRDNGRNTKIDIDTSFLYLFHFNIFDWDNSNRIVEIKMPKKTFTKAKINMGSGNTTISGINAEDYDIEIGSGSLEFDSSLSKSKSFRLDMGSGKSVFNGVNTENYKIDIGSGTCTIDEISGTGDIDMGSGLLDITFMDSPAGKFDMGSGHATMNIHDSINTTFKFTIGSGSVDFNACGKDKIISEHDCDDIVLGNGENTFKIGIGSGKVDVKSAGTQKFASSNMAEQIQSH